MRVTRLPAFENEFGKDDSTFAGVRQTRFGVRTVTPTELGDLKTTFEFELFGTGVDEGQTTFRLRHAYGELGRVWRGQSWSPFMDPDVFPNSIRVLGTDGHGVLPQRAGALDADPGRYKSLMIALERPGASGDGGIYADRIELQDIKARFPLPDISGASRAAELGLRPRRRHPRADQLGRHPRDPFDLSGEGTGWGINLSSNLKHGKDDVVRLQFVFGEGIQNYMNDSPVDVGIVNNSRSRDADPRRGASHRRLSWRSSITPGTR